MQLQEEKYHFQSYISPADFANSRSLARAHHSPEKPCSGCVNNNDNKSRSARRISRNAWQWQRGGRGVKRALPSRLRCNFAVATSLGTVNVKWFVNHSRTYYTSTRKHVASWRRRCQYLRLIDLNASSPRAARSIIFLQLESNRSVSAARSINVIENADSAVSETRVNEHSEMPRCRFTARFTRATP